MFIPLAIGHFCNAWYQKPTAPPSELSHHKYDGTSCGVRCSDGTMAHSAIEIVIKADDVLEDGHFNTLGSFDRLLARVGVHL